MYLRQAKEMLPNRVHTQLRVGIDGACSAKQRPNLRCGAHNVSRIAIDLKNGATDAQARTHTGPSVYPSSAVTTGAIITSYTSA